MNSNTLSERLAFTNFAKQLASRDMVQIENMMDPTAPPETVDAQPATVQVQLPACACKCICSKGSYCSVLAGTCSTHEGLIACDLSKSLAH